MQKKISLMEMEIKIKLKHKKEVEKLQNLNKMILLTANKTHQIKINVIFMYLIFNQKFFFLILYLKNS
jgi:hypothetical protein